MTNLTKIASLPGSGSGCMAALPAEVGKASKLSADDMAIINEAVEKAVSATVARVCEQLAEMVGVYRTTAAPVDWKTVYRGEPVFGYACSPIIGEAIDPGSPDLLDTSEDGS